jgi:predicted ATPase
VPRGDRLAPEDRSLLQAASVIGRQFDPQVLAAVIGERDNRLAEVVEVLAHHYSQTDRAAKAFAYLTMAGNKSLSVYSLDEAELHFTSALALLDKNSDCAADDQVAEFLCSGMFLFFLTGQIKKTIDIFERFLTRISDVGWCCRSGPRYI